MSHTVVSMGTNIKLHKCLLVSQFHYTSLCNCTYLYAYLILHLSGVCVFYCSHWTETNSHPPTRKVLSYNTQPARSPANAIKNATDLHLPARKMISLCLKFRTPPLFSHLIGSTLSCLNTVKFAGYICDYDSIIHKMWSSLYNTTGTWVGCAAAHPTLQIP
jgi:hypothetical protein